MDGKSTCQFKFVCVRQSEGNVNVQNAVTGRDNSSLTSALVVVVVIVTTAYESKMSVHQD